MKGTNLGEFEELVLLVVVALPQEAYSVAIADEIRVKAGRKVAHSVVHTALYRLEEKGFLKSLDWKDWFSRREAHKKASNE